MSRAWALRFNLKTTGSLITAREGQTATMLPNGKVLVAGGSGSHGYLKSAELYDPASGTWTRTADLRLTRSLATATLLRNGKVLVAGGFGNFRGAFKTAELYDPATGTWTQTGSLNDSRYNHTATLLPNGKVLVCAGGYRSERGALRSGKRHLDGDRRAQ